MCLSSVFRSIGKAIGVAFFGIALCCSGWSKEISLNELNAGLDPRQPGIQAFATYLKGNRIEISYAEAERRWRVIEESEVIRVSIRSLPCSASEDEMSMAIRQINLAYLLNVKACMAMSYPSHTQKSAKTRKTADRLVQLFKEYDPQKPVKFNNTQELGNGRPTSR